MLVEVVVMVNGYGVPNNILEDRNYANYVLAALDDAGRSRRQMHLVFAGGATNPRYTDRTEAGEMKRLYEILYANNELVKNLVHEVRVAEQGCTAEDNLRALAQIVHECRQINGRKVEVVIYCEYARQDWMRFLASRYVPGAKVVPIDFDAGRERFARFGHWPSTALKIAAYYVPGIHDHVVMPLRYLHMSRDSKRRSRSP